MGLASTLTDIANLALSSIGEVVIQNIDDDSSVARDVRRVLYESIRQVQLEILWNDLIVVDKLTQSASLYCDDSPELLQYNLPNNFLDVIELKSGHDWIISNKKLVTIDTNPTLIYKRYSEEPTEWSGYMTELIYRRLAANVAMALTQNSQVTQMAIGAYEKVRLDNLVRSSNRSRKERKRSRGYGNLRSRQVTNGGWPNAFLPRL